MTAESMTNSEETGDETNSKASAEASPEPGAALEHSAPPDSTATPAASSPEAATPVAAASFEDAGAAGATARGGFSRRGFSWRGFSWRGLFSWRGIVGAVAALVVVAGILAAYHVGGVGSADGGPLSIATVDSTGTVPRGTPAVVVIPIAASRSAAVVIDAVDLRGGDQRRAPIPFAVLADRDESCSGIWWPLGGTGSFARRCAPDGTAPLIGGSVPIGGPASAPGTASQSVRTVDVAIEVAGPGPGHCWDVGSVRIQYHVGGHHYTAVGLESISACAGLTAETANGPIAADG